MNLNEKKYSQYALVQEMMDTVETVKKFNPEKCYMNVIIEIRDEGLHGREFLGDEIEITSLITV